MRKLLVMLSLALMAASCGGVGSKSESEGGRVEENLYAQWYRIVHFDGYISVEINNPWDTTKILQRYMHLS